MSDFSSTGGPGGFAPSQRERILQRADQMIQDLGAAASRSRYPSAPIPVEVVNNPPVERKPIVSDEYLRGVADGIIQRGEAIEQAERARKVAEARVNQLEQSNRQLQSKLADAERRAADAERRLRELTGGSSTTYRSATPSTPPSYVPQPVPVPTPRVESQPTTSSIQKPDRSRFANELDYRLAMVTYQAEQRAGRRLYSKNPFISLTRDQSNQFMREHQSYFASLVSEVARFHAADLGAQRTNPFSQDAYVEGPHGLTVMAVKHERGTIYVGQMHPFVATPIYGDLRNLYENILGGVNGSFGFPVANMNGGVGFREVTSQSGTQGFESSFYGGYIYRSFGSLHPITHEISSQWWGQDKAYYGPLGLPRRSVVANGTVASVTFENGQTLYGS